MKQLGIEKRTVPAGVFGVCYSILTWSGVGKGFGIFSPSSWVKSAGKLVENGHATTFLIDLEKDTITMTGISDDGWVFDTDDIRKMNWARRTGNATTYVYYVEVDSQFIKKYETVKNELEGTQTTYSALWPNLPRAKTTYQNCVSHAHCLMSKLGIAYFNPQRKGWWAPSIGNWMQWLKNFIPGRTYGTWKYKRIMNTNTHIP